MKPDENLIRDCLAQFDLSPKGRDLVIEKINEILKERGEEIIIEEEI